MKHLILILVLLLTNAQEQVSIEDRYDITDILDNLLEFGVGNGCEGEFANSVNHPISYVYYNGNLDLSCKVLQLNKADLLINGVLLYEDNQVTKEYLIEIGHLIVTCDDSQITYQ